MRRGTIVVVIFILVVLAIIGASQFLRSQPALEYTLAVDPLIQPWAESAVKDFNATQPLVNNARRVLFKVTVIDDLDVWNGKSNWTPDHHPALWIPAAATSLRYAVESGMPLVNGASVARTPLVWGGYISRVDVVTQQGAQPLDWGAVAEAAKAESWAKIGGQTDWQFVKLAFPQPNRKMSGLAALLTGAAAFNKQNVLTGELVRSDTFRAWLRPVLASIPNFNTLGGDPAATMISRGSSSVEIALFPEVQWLNNLKGFSGADAIRLSYPESQFVLDFPLARWQDDRTANEQSAAAQLLTDYLTGAAQQAKLPDFGLRPATGEPPSTAKLFADAAQYGIQLQPGYGRAVSAPPRNETQGLIQWFESEAGR
jgi:hypothetical protein